MKIPRRLPSGVQANRGGRIAGLTACLGAILLGAGPAQGQTTDPVQTQTIALQQGWNAIHLKVDPLDASPGAVFTNLPVTKVATFFPTRTPVEFIQDPASAPWKQSGWNVWFAPSLPEAAVNNLSSLSAGQAYLVYATAGATLNVPGTVRSRRIRWRADSYNFVGFPVDSTAPPTFAAWFAGSTAHQSATRTVTYTLDNGGHWAPVARPESTLVQPNAAYWVYCQGASDYQGPLDVAIPLGVPGNGVDFGDVTQNATVRFRNPTSTPIRFTVEFSPADGLPLSYQQKVLSSGEQFQVSLASPANFGPLEAGGELSLRLTLDRALMTGTNGAAVLTVRDDVGSAIRIPVTGRLP